MASFGRLAMLEFTVILLFTWTLFGLKFQGCFADQGRFIMFKELIQNKALTHHVIRSEDVPNEGSCRVLCYMENDCVSINVGPLVKGKHKCELNNATAEHQGHTHALTNMDGYTYLAIENPCNSNPCMYQGKCQAGFTAKGFRCLCRQGFKGTHCQEAPNCGAIYMAGEHRDGIYTIKPDDLDPFDVYCDQTTDGGGWTVFQKRLDGSVEFYLNWTRYERGFGNLSGEFWLGLDKIHHLTSDNNTVLRVDLEDGTGYTAYAMYTTCRVMSKQDKYKLILAYYNGTAGDSLSNQSNGQYFSTKDQDNDNSNLNCAREFHGAWWYRNCHESNLNGRYKVGTEVPRADGVVWYTWRGHKYGLKRAEMKIRPFNFKRLG